MRAADRVAPLSKRSGGNASPAGASASASGAGRGAGGRWSAATPRVRREAEHWQLPARASLAVDFRSGARLAAQQPLRRGLSQPPEGAQHAALNLPQHEDPRSGGQHDCRPRVQSRPSSQRQISARATPDTPIAQASSDAASNRLWRVSLNGFAGVPQALETRTTAVAPGSWQMFQVYYQVYYTGRASPSSQRRAKGEFASGDQTYRLFDSRLFNNS
jgi:hypothetical protein